MKKRVCAYCRVSTDKKDQKNSYDNQKSYFDRVIRDNQDYELIGIYADEGLSGTKLYRPKFDEMLRDAGLQRVTDEATGKLLDYYVIVDKPKFDIIFVKDISRFARNVSADVLLKTLALNKVYVAYNSDDGTYSTETSTGFSYIQGALQAAEQLSRVISRNVRFGMREGAENGNIFVGNNFYGYKYLPHPENRLEIIEDEAKVVRKIFELYLDGFGSERICRILADEYQMFTRKGKRFSSTTILGMLKNEKYAGLSYAMKFHTGDLFGDKRKRCTTKEEQVRSEPDKIPPIISKETFKKAQKIRENNTSHKINKGKYLGKTDYAGILICGKCGTSYQACGVKHLKTRTVRYFACRCRYRFDTDNGIEECRNPTVRQDKLDELLNSTGYSFRRWNRIKNGLIELKRIRSVLESRIDKDNDVEIMQLQEQIEDTRIKKKRLLPLYMEGKYSKDELDELLQPLEKELNELTDKVKELSKTNEEIYKDITDIDKVIEMFEEENNTLKEEFNSGVVRQKLSRKELLKDIDNIVVMPDGMLILNFKSLAVINEIVRKHRFLLDKVS